MSAADFTRRFGHLRPGSYDITSRCYRDRPLLTGASSLPQQLSEHPPFSPSTAESDAIETLLGEAGIVGVSASELFQYARRAIQGREYGKFVFTRNLSDILENIASWGIRHEVPREHLALIDIQTWCSSPSLQEVNELIPAAQTERHTACATRLGALLTTPDDLLVVPTPRAAANFVGQNAIQAEVICLDNQEPDPEDLAGKLVCIRNADPGYDWIFTGSIAGLITQYGGSNSHMAIRSAEFGLPAAIGCGKQLYERITSSPAAELNCGNRTLVPIDH